MGDCFFHVSDEGGSEGSESIGPVEDGGWACGGWGLQQWRLPIGSEQRFGVRSILGMNGGYISLLPSAVDHQQADYGFAVVKNGTQHQCTHERQRRRLIYLLRTIRTTCC